MSEETGAVATHFVVIIPAGRCPCSTGKASVHSQTPQLLPGTLGLPTRHLARSLAALGRTSCQVPEGTKMSELTRRNAWCTLSLQYGHASVSASNFARALSEHCVGQCCESSHRNTYRNPIRPQETCLRKHLEEAVRVAGRQSWKRCRLCVHCKTGIHLCWVPERTLGEHQ